MHSLYGVATHSLSLVHEQLYNWCQHRRLRLRVLTLQDEHTEQWRWQVRSAHVLLLPSFEAFRKHLPHLNFARGVVVVFDAPLALTDIPSLVFLDIDKRVRFSYTFTLIDLNFTDLKAAILASRDLVGSLLHVTIERVDVLPRLISSFQSTSFMDKFNNLMYSFTNHASRNKVRAAMLRLIRREMAPIDFERSVLDRYVKTSTAARGTSIVWAFYKEFMTYLQAPAGIALYKALMRIEQVEKTIKNKKKQTSKTSSVPYDKIAREFKVDRFDLKNLSAMRRYLTRANEIPIKLTDLAKSEFTRVKKVSALQ